MFLHDQGHPENQKKLGDIKHKIMVMSGKGGVGKSTTAANIAIGLSKKGYKVGLLDTDLHGPSITKILGLESKKVDLTDQKSEVIPIPYSDNLKVISIQFLLQDPDSALIWRGPVKIGVIRQFIADVKWERLDYLIIDSPPGTGDEPLTVAQTIPGCHALIVTTPQNVSIADVRKSINFCKQVQMPILGILENMSGFVCPHCGKDIDLFKKHGGKIVANEFGYRFLGAIPIEPEIVVMGDSGTSIYDIDKETLALSAYNEIVEGIEKYMEKTPVETSAEEKSESKNIEIKKIAIPTVEGNLCAHFGHCEKFALIDIDNKEIKNVEFLIPPPHEPGVIPKWLSEQKADLVITGGMGNRAKEIFSQHGIEVITGVTAQVPPEEIVKQYLENTLEIGDNACDH